MSDRIIHRCHARECSTPIPPRLLFCLRHWRMVPKDLQRQVWRHYRPGQEKDKRPSAEYLQVRKQVVEAVWRIEYGEETAK